MIENSFKLKEKQFYNRLVFQPMEGCDCETDGAPGKLTVEKYKKFANSGAGLIWFEACSVCPEGRTNIHQMMLTKNNLRAFQSLIREVKEISMKKFGFAPLLVLQLTHSGRQSISPMVLYHNEVYEATRPVSDKAIVSDEYLENLPVKFAESALLAKEAGFDGVDVKCCHGYLMQESLSAFRREGKFGGEFNNRIRLYLSCFRAVKENIGSDMLLACRLSVSDMVQKPFGFGTDEQNNLDLTESKKLISIMMQEGLDILNVTLGNPYFNPHVNRPYRYGGYVSSENPEKGVMRFENVEKQLKETFPSLPIVASGLSYYRERVFEQSERLLQENACDFVGFGRLGLAYPDCYTDYIHGKFEGQKTCLTCSKCTELMRNGCAVGCVVFNEYYTNLYKEKVKKAK